MSLKDDLVLQLLELDAEIEAAEQRRQLNNREARAWASSALDAEPDIQSGNESRDVARWIKHLRDQREALDKLIASLPELE